MKPVARGIAGGLLLSLVVVTGVTLLSGGGPFEGTAASFKQDLQYVSSVTPATTTMTATTTAAATTTGPPAVIAAQSAATSATISSVQPKSLYSVLLTSLPVAVALVLGASVYLI